MTKAQAVAEFKSQVLPAVRHAHEQDGVPDYPARCEAWNDFTDELCRSRRITSSQYSRWSHPRCNEE